jgi:acyl-CoA thioester hydrolase
MIDLSAFTFSFPIQIRWKDLDALGHVNNAVFITYFELARGHYMPTACPGWNWHKHMFLIGNVQVDFKKEVRLTTPNPKVYMRTTRIGTKSFVLEYALVSQEKGETQIHATGATTQIMFAMKERKTIPIADWVRNNLERYEKAL